MNKNKIFAGLVLAIFLLAIPQVVNAGDATRDIEFSGEYLSNNGISGEINGEIVDENLDGTMIIRGLEYPIHLTLVMKRGDLEWYSGTITRCGREFGIRMILRISTSAEIIRGAFGCPELNFDGYFTALIE